MVAAKLHVICGNCGESEMFLWKLTEDGKYRYVYLICENCDTIHDIDDNANRYYANIYNVK